jgi:hypothetical protein
MYPQVKKFGATCSAGFKKNISFQKSDRECRVIREKLVARMRQKWLLKNIFLGSTRRRKATERGAGKEE